MQSASNPRSCVIYARKSQDREDKQILSIPAQLDVLREYAARNNLEVTEEFTEARTARKPGRPVFAQLIRGAQSGTIRRILSWKLDRLARNPIDGGQLIYLLGEKVLLELVTPEGIYTGSSDSKFMLAVLFGAATKMTDDLADGVRRGNKKVHEMGRITGLPPLGYKKVRERAGFRGAGRVVPDPKRFPIVQKIWREMLSGTVTVAEVWRRAVNEWGLTVRNTKRSRGRPMSVGAVYAMLDNRFYAGEVVRLGVTYQGEHEPVVSKKEFDKVQDLIHRRCASRPSRHEFLYAGLLTCGDCGTLLTGEQHTKRSGRQFVYYRCGKRKPPGQGCYALAPREERISADIERLFERATIPPELLDWTLRAIDYWAETDATQQRHEARLLDESIVAAEAELRRLTDLLIAGLLEEDDFKARRDELNRRLQSLRASREDPTADVQAWRATVEEAMTTGLEMLPAFQKGTPEEKRQLLAAVSQNRVVTRGITNIHWRFPFSILPEAADLGLGANSPSQNPPPVDEILHRIRKKTRPRNARERAFSMWCAKLFEARTRFWSAQDQD